MEKSYSNQISENYSGSLVQTGKSKIYTKSIEIERLNDILVKIAVDMDFGKVVFRAMLSEQEEGILMHIQNRVTKDYILKGQSGFLYKKSNVHGGYLKNLDSFYFHVNLSFFNNVNKEIYFLGKTPSEGSFDLERNENTSELA
jgi:hypothetical protein